eukprot:2895671-Prymnesium_polylepis.1
MCRVARSCVAWRGHVSRSTVMCHASRACSRPGVDRCGRARGGVRAGGRLAPGAAAGRRQ